MVLVLGGLLLSGSGDSWRRTAQARAAIELEEDFSALDHWTGGTREWSRDAAGFMRVGALALLQPSLRMTDYRLEFLGQIERQALGWVFRAADLENYYASKIVVVKPGPVPALALVRYAMVAGREAQRVQVPLRIGQNRGLYRVQLLVSGSDFTTSIEGELVDFWSDDRLKTGGIGFFADRGARAHLYWAKVSYQDDTLGKICAFFAPNQMKSRSHQ